MHFPDRTDITELLILFSSIMKLGIVLLPTSQPSEDARLVRRQHYRAVRKYCVGGKNLE